jgi:hypothetical protein
LPVALAGGCPIAPTLDEERWETRRKLHLNRWGTSLNIAALALRLMA